MFVIFQDYRKSIPTLTSNKSVVSLHSLSDLVDESNNGEEEGDDDPALMRTGR